MKEKSIEKEKECWVRSRSTSWSNHWLALISLDTLVTTSRIEIQKSKKIDLHINY